jgi:hypothetical protein
MCGGAHIRLARVVYIGKQRAADGTKASSGKPNAPGDVAGLVMAAVAVGRRVVRQPADGSAAFLLSDDGALETRHQLGLVARRLETARF